MAFARACRERHGGVFTLRFGGGLDLVAVSDPVAVDALHDAGGSLHRGAAPTRRRVLGEASPIVLDGEPHTRARAVSAPAAALATGQRDAIGELAAAHVERWPCGRPVELLPHLQDLVRDVLLRTVCGLDGPPAARLWSAVLEVRATQRRRAPSIPLVRRRWGPGVPTRRSRAALADLDAVLLGEIAARRRDHRDGNDVLSALLAARDPSRAPLADRAVRDHVVTMLLHGHDPTVAAAAWTFERLARHPRLLERVRDDEQLADATVREVLRLRPPSWLTSARITAAPMLLGGHELPAGALVTVFTHLLHRDAAAFPSPLALRPERFREDPAGAARWWVPFGGGHRRCLGDELAVLVAATVLREAVRRLDVRPAVAGDEAQREVGVVFVPGNGASVVTTPRV